MAGWACVNSRSWFQKCGIERNPGLEAACKVFISFDIDMLHFGVVCAQNESGAAGPVGGVDQHEY